jgi:hypothetical protein
VPIHNLRRSQAQRLTPPPPPPPAGRTMEGFLGPLLDVRNLEEEDYEELSTSALHTGVHTPSALAGGGLASVQGGVRALSPKDFVNHRYRSFTDFVLGAASCVIALSMYGEHLPTVGEALTAVTTYWFTLSVWAKAVRAGPCRAVT